MRGHPQSVITADCSGQTTAENLRVPARACGLTDLIDEFGPVLLAAIGWIEKPWTGDGFQTNGEFTPTPRIAQPQGMFERGLEKRLGLLPFADARPVETRQQADFGGYGRHAQLLS